MKPNMMKYYAAVKNKGYVCIDTAQSSWCIDK